MSGEVCKDCGRAIGFLGCESPGSRTFLQITNQRLRAEVEALRETHRVSHAQSTVVIQQLASERESRLRAEARYAAHLKAIAENDFDGNQRCDYCHGIGACPRCWGRAGIELEKAARLRAERERDEARDAARRLIPFVETSAEILADQAEPDELEEAREAVAAARAALSSPAVTGLGNWADAYRERIAAWVKNAFGEGALTDRWERAARVVEEAIELAQAEGLDSPTAARILLRVYDRPAGDVKQEAAGLMVCFLAWTAGTGTDLRAVTLTEIERIERPEVTARIRAKQLEKAQAGTGKGYAAPTNDPRAAPPKTSEGA